MTLQFLENVSNNLSEENKNEEPMTVKKVDEIIEKSFNQLKPKKDEGTN